MKNAGFMAVAAFVGWAIAQFLPVPPGVGNSLTFLATVSALVGALLGLLPVKGRLTMAVVSVVALVVFLFALLGFLHVVGGEPSQAAEWQLYGLTLFIFVPLGVIIEMLGRGF